jgi:hypothetical protein
MTKEYRNYTCEHGHNWTLYRNTTDEEKPEEVFCPEGHEMVMRFRHNVIDDAQITLRPAGRIINSITQQESKRGRYYVVISSQNSDEEFVTDVTYRWEEACAFARKFDKRAFSWVQKYWSKIKQ